MKRLAGMPPVPAGAVQVNGQVCAAPMEPATLLRWLRDEAGHHDVRQACETGHCGACAVRLEGTTVKACSVLAGEADGCRVLTLEGLVAGGGRVTRSVWAAMRDARVFQCDYCAPAFVFAAIDLLEQNANPTPAQIRSALDGLLCRCTGYQSIVEAIGEAARRLAEGDGRSFVDGQQRESA